MGDDDESLPEYGEMELTNEDSQSSKPRPKKKGIRKKLMVSPGTVKRKLLLRPGNNKDKKKLSKMKPSELMKSPEAYNTLSSKDKKLLDKMMAKELYL